MKNFWNKLPKPFFALAPMADVTDAAFRRMIAKYSKYGGQEIFDKGGKFTRPHQKVVGGPDVMWTEFVSADGLLLGGYDKLIKDLEYSEAERPIVAQFFSAEPERTEKAAALVGGLGFDGVDINMGCPDRSVEKQMAGSAMIKNPELAKKIIRATKRGTKNKIPVSVKTRIGYHRREELEEWLPALLSEEPAAVTIHARTKKEMSKVSAHWEDIKRAVEIKNSLGSGVLIIGNGDVKSLKEAKKRVEETGCDGVMIGRAVLGNPWFFDGRVKYDNLSPEEKLKALSEHIKFFDQILGSTKSFAVMKKHFKAYVSDWLGAKELRAKLMNADSASEAESVIENYLKR